MTKSKKKKPLWKKAQDKKNVKKRKLKALFGIGFLFTILFIIFGGGLLLKAKDSVWDGKSRFGLIFEENDNLKLEIFLVNQKRRFELIIPGNVVVNVPFGFGEYNLNKVYKLGNIDKKGGELLLETVQRNLAVSVLGWKIDNETNLSWWDELRLKQLRIKFDQPENYNLLNLGLLSKGRDNSGELIYRIKFSILDNWINKQLFDDQLVVQGLSISVINGTNVIGIADNVMRLIKNLGGDVISVGNYDKQKESVILISEERFEKSLTAKRLSLIFDIPKIEIQPDDEFRADIVVILGEDFIIFD